MLATPKKADYAGTSRHQCPRCRREASIRRLIRRDAGWDVVGVIVYCEWADCGWEAGQ